MIGLIFTYLLFAYGAALGWFKPLHGLMVFYAFTILRPPHLWFWSVGNTSTRYSFWLGVSTLTGWAFKNFGDWRALRPIAAPVFCLGLYLLSGMVALQINAINSSQAMDQWIIQFKIALVVFVSLTIITRPREIKILAWILLIGHAYLAYVFNEQYYTQNYNRVYWRGFGGIDNNGIAMVMVMATPIAFYMGVWTKRWYIRLACLVSAILIAHVVLLSYSRGGQLGLIIVGIIIFISALISLPRKMLTVLIAVLFTAAVLELAGPSVRKEFATIFLDKTERDESANSRFVTWQAGLTCMLENPIGMGPRQFNRVADQYGIGRGKSVHNLFIQTGADYGVLGLIGLAGFYILSALQTWNMTRTKTARAMQWPQYFGYMVITSLAGMFICSQFIGMESVETGFILSTLGLCTTAYIRRVEAGELAGAAEVPELEQVPAEFGGQYKPELA